MKPDPATHNTTPEYARDIIDRIGRPQRWICEQSGITLRRLAYILAGKRTNNGREYAVEITYPEQFILECLAEAAEIMRHK